MPAAALWKPLLLLLSLRLAAIRKTRRCSEEAGETLGALGLLELMHESMGPRDIADDIISERQGPCLWVLWTHMGRLSIYILSTGPTTQGSCGVKE